MCSGRGTWTFLQVGFPIRTSPDHRSVVTFPGLFADSNVLHRLSMPRHPPCALSSLLLLQDARVHCEVLKIRSVPHPDRRLLTTASGSSVDTVRGIQPKLIPQDPTVCQARSRSLLEVPAPKGVLTSIVSDRPTSRRPLVSCTAWNERPRSVQWTYRRTGRPSAP